MATCKQCEADFKETTYWQRFCSDKCRNAYHNTTNPVTTRGKRSTRFNALHPNDPTRKAKAKKLGRI